MSNGGLEESVVNSLLEKSTARKQAILDKYAVKESRLAEQSVKHQELLLKQKMGLAREPLDVAADTARFIGQGVVDVNKTVYGLGELVLKPGNIIGEALGTGTTSLEKLTGVAPKEFAEDKQEIAGYMTPQTQYRQTKKEEAQAEFNAGREARLEASKEAGESDFMAHTKENLKAARKVVDSYLDDPLSIVEDTLVQLPQLLISGGVGSLGAKAATAGMSATQARTYLASKAGQDAVKKASERAAITYVGASEGASNAVDAKAKVLDMNIKELIEDSPYAAQLAEQGLSEDQIKMQTADRVFDMTFAIASTVGAATSKLTGAGKFEGNLFNKDGTISGILNKVIDVSKNTLRETTEEAIQGASGTIAGNVAEKTYVDPEQDVTEGVGEAVASGAIIGGTLGGGAATTKAVVDTAVSAGEKVTTKIDKEISNKQHKEAITTKAKEEGVEAVTNVDTSDFDIEHSLTAIQKLNSEKGVSEEEKAKNHLAAINVFQETVEKIDGIQEEIANETNPEVKAYKQKLVDTLQEKLEKAPKQIEQIRLGTAVSNEDVVNTIKSKGDTPLGSSINSITLEQAESLVEEDITDLHKQELTDHIKTQKAMAEVSSNILSGGEGFIGIKNYIDGITGALENGNSTRVSKLQEGLSTFAGRHNTKATRFEEAYRPFREAGSNAKNVRLNGEERARIEAIAQDYDGFVIGPNSKRVVDNIKLEAAALNAAVTQANNIVNRSSQQAPVTPTQPTPTKETTEEVISPVESQGAKAQPIATETTGQVEDKTYSGSKDLDNYLDLHPELKRTKAIKKAIDSGKQLSSTQIETQLTAYSKLAPGSIDKPKVEARAVPEKVEGYNLATEITKEDSTDNQIKKFFNPKSVSDTAVSLNALQEENDFFERVEQDPSIIEPYVTLTETKEDDGTVTKEVTPEQKFAINHLTKFVKEASTSINKLFDGVIHKTAHRDLLKELAVNGKLPSNVKSAISVGAFNWVANKAGDTVYNDQAGINSILGRDSDVGVTPPMWKMLSKIGVGRSVVVNDIGKNIYSSLGLTEDKNAPQNLKANLINALGSMGAATLLDNGYLEEHTVSTHEILNLTGADTSNIPKNQTRTFYRAATTTETNEVGNLVDRMTDKVFDIGDSVKNTEGLLEDLFSVENTRTGPVYESPKPSLKRKVKGNDQVVSKEVNEALNTHEARAHYLKSNVIDAYKFLSRTDRLVMAGYVVDPDKTVQIALRPGVVAKNASIERELDYLDSFIETTETKGKDTPFYFKHEIWKNLRVGMLSNTFNPQGSKVHRHFINQADWNTKVDLTNSASTAQFISAVAESLGIDADKQSQGKTVKEGFDLVGSDEIVKAVTALNQINTPNLTEAQKSALSADIMAVATDTHAFDALVNLAAYQSAIESGATEFESNLFREVDGVTNGVAIGTLMLNAGNSDTDRRSKLNRTGMFFDGVTDDFGKYLEQKNPDLYQDIAKAWGKLFNTLTPTPELQAMERLFVQLVNAEGQVTKAGRKVSKSPLMTTVYGAGKKAIKRSVGDAFITKFYTDVQEAVVNNDIDKLTQLQSDMNQIIGGRLPNIDLTKTPLEQLLNPKSEKAVRQQVEQSYGTKLTEAIEEGYGDYQSKGKLINDSMAVIFNGFMLLYNDRVAKRTAELVASGDLIEGRHSLPKIETDQILADLLEAQPIVHNYFSSKSQELKEGLFVGKYENQQIIDDAHIVDQRYKERPTNSKYKGIKTYSSERVMVTPGASPTVLLVQSIDASTMISFLAKHAALGVHDAIIVGQDNTLEKGEKMNEQYTNVIKNFSIMGATSDALTRSINTIKEYDSINGTKFYDELNSNTRDELSELDLNLMGESSAIDYIQTKVQRTTQSIDAGKHKDMDEATGQFQYFVAGIKSNLNPDNSEDIQGAVDTVVETVKENSSDQIRSVSEIDNSILGSTTDQIDTENFQPTTSERVSDMNSEEVFDSLDLVGSIAEDVNHKEYLRGLLKDSVNKVLEPFNLHQKTSTTTETIGATTTLDMFIINQLAPNAPTLSGMLANGIRMSTQEVYLHELVHNISRAGIDRTSLATRRLKKLWLSVKANTTVEDFMSDSSLQPSDPTYVVEREAAEKRYDHIFNIRTNKTRIYNESTQQYDTIEKADYLHEFVAFGLTNQKFRKHLETITPQIETDAGFSGNVLERLSQLFQKALDFLSRLFIVGSKVDIRADQKIDNLFNALANIDRRKKTQIEQELDKVFTFSDRQMNKVVELTKRQLAKVAELPAIKDSKFGPVKLAGTIGHLATTERGEYFITGLGVVKDKIQKGKQGFIGATVTEMVGRTDNNGMFHDLNRVSNMTIDQQRNAIKTMVAETLLEQYGHPLTDLEKDSITKAIIKTDLVSLMTKYSLDEINDFMNVSDTKLETEINTLVNQLGSYTDANFFIRSSKALGRYMAQGEVIEHHLLLNARKIAEVSVPGKSRPPINEIEEVTEIVDHLASLYAIKNTSTTHRKATRELILQEQARGTDNGITFTLEQHRDMKREAQEKLFGGHNAMVKGYTKEILNPHISIEYGTRLDEEVMARRMYVRTENKLKRDINDPNQEEIFMYISKDGGMATFSAGIISRTSKKAKGIDTVGTRMQADDNNPVLNGKLDIDRIRVSKQSAIDDMFNSPNTPTTVGSIMVPITDNNGDILSYRYMMKEQTKDSVLEKHNEFQDVMGAMAASTVDKLATRDINNRTIRALRQQYDEEFADRLESYVEIGPRSQDKELREMYYTLPAETRMELARVWNGDTMYVRNDLVTLVFGQRKVSVSDIWQKDEDDQTMFDKVFIIIAETFLRTQAAGRLRRAENVWQELVKMLKDAIVIKSFVVTLFNTVSNMVSLKMLGVTSKDIIKGHVEAFANATKYQADARELFKLEQELKYTGRGRKQRIAELKTDLANNPVRELIQSGAFQTIVEDIETKDGGFSYSTKLGKFIESKTPEVFNRVPEGVKTVVKNAFITHDSASYKVLNQAAQLSDFVARYTLHQYYTTRVDNPLSKKDSIAKIMSIFIDYDLPTHRMTQYGNDMGVVWFSKYNMRIQRILFESMRENPARIMMFMALQGAFGDIPDMFDGSYMVKNPLGIIHDPLNQIDAFSEIATFKAVDNLL